MKFKVAVSICAMQILMHDPLLAGGSIGGSGPPAKEILEPLLMSRDMGAGGLFKTDLGDIQLGVNRELSNELMLTKAKVPAPALAISEADFTTLSSSNGNIEVMTIGVPQPQIRSYVIEDGNRLGELLLRDRRERARSSAK